MWKQRLPARVTSCHQAETSRNGQIVVNSSSPDRQCTIANVRKSDREETFVGRRSNDKDAPQAALHPIEVDRRAGPIRESIEECLKSWVAQNHQTHVR